MTDLEKLIEARAVIRSIFEIQDHGSLFERDCYSAFVALDDVIKQIEKRG